MADRWSRCIVAAHRPGRLLAPHRLLEGNFAEGRTRLFKEVFDVYGARSNVVHGNRSSRRSAEDMVVDALQLVLRVLITILYSAQWLLDTPKSADRGLVGQQPFAI
jgi:hypothetical protein